MFCVNFVRMFALIIGLFLILTYAVFVIYAERKVAAFIQDRLGPMETGPYGLLQTIADLIKLLQKEDIIPTGAQAALFKWAPIIIFAAVFAGFSTLPLAPDLVGSSANVGVFFLLSIVSIDVIGIFIAGWSSNNKFSILGSMRGIAQIISYELPLTLSVLSVLLLMGTLNLEKINYLQSAQFISDTKTAYYPFFSFTFHDVQSIGGFFTWNIVRYPFLLVSFVIFFIASLAECNRAPFDIPEGESEIVSGFHTEYSGFRFAILFLAEYAMMLLVSLLMVILFLGGWNSPLPNIGSVTLCDWTTGTGGELSATIWGFFWLVSKAFGLVFLQIMMRWTYPRLRVDQLMNLCWKVLLPVSLVMVVVSALWVYWLKV